MLRATSAHFPSSHMCIYIPISDRIFKFKNQECTIDSSQNTLYKLICQICHLNINIKLYIISNTLVTLDWIFIEKYITTSKICVKFQCSANNRFWIKYIIWKYKNTRTHTDIQQQLQKNCNTDLTLKGCPISYH